MDSSDFGSPLEIDEIVGDHEQLALWEIRVSERPADEVCVAFVFGMNRDGRVA